MIDKYDINALKAKLESNIGKKIIIRYNKEKIKIEI